DDDILTIGSSNMDMRSFSQNGEVTLMIIDPELVRAAVGVLDGYAAVSDQLDLHDWLARPGHQQYRDDVVRLIAGVLEALGAVGSRPRLLRARARARRRERGELARRGARKRGAPHGRPGPVPSGRPRPPTGPTARRRGRGPP